MKVLGVADPILGPSDYTNEEIIVLVNTASALDYFAESEAGDLVSLLDRWKVRLGSGNPYSGNRIHCHKFDLYSDFSVLERSSPSFLLYELVAGEV